MTIGKRIKAAMKRADGGEGINQSELARRLGVKPQAVQSWVRDERPIVPRQARMSSIARVLGVTEGYLYGTESEEKRQEKPESAQQLLHRISAAAPELRPKELAVLRAYLDALILMREDEETARPPKEAKK
jgi:transcriptional regulator with XRE-family HTH domain